MWPFNRLLSSKPHRRDKRHPVIKHRRLTFEQVEERRLLSIDIGGRIEISNLPCAALTSTNPPVCANVPVWGALVKATYTTAGGRTAVTTVRTDADGDYLISLNVTAVPDTPVIISVTAQSQLQFPGGQPAYVVVNDSTRTTVWAELDDWVATAGNFYDSANDLTLNYNVNPIASASFAAFSMLHMDYNAATQGLKAVLTSPLTVVAVTDSSGGIY